MTLVGCDLHSRKQQVAALDTATGEVLEQELVHEGDAVERFYRAVPSSNSSGRSTCRAPSVFVMEPTDARNLHYPALARPLRRPMLGRVFSQG